MSRIRAEVESRFVPFDRSRHGLTIDGTLNRCGICHVNASAVMCGLGKKVIPDCAPCKSRAVFRIVRNRGDE